MRLQVPDDFIARVDGLSRLDPELYFKGVQLIRELLKSALKALQGEGVPDLYRVVRGVGVEVEELRALLNALFD